MASDNQCFTARPSVVRPDPRLAMAHLTTGSAGRALTEAIFAGNIAAVRQMLAADPKLFLTQVTFDPKMQSAPTGQYGDLLTFAVAACNSEMVQVLLELGMPADGVQRGEALGLALLSDSPDMAEIILRAGASPDPQKQGGKNVMYELVAFGAVGGVQTLVRHKADLQYVDSSGNDHLDTALTMEQFAISEILVGAGAQLWRINGAGAVSAWTLNKPPVLVQDKSNLAARDRLIERAKGAGLPWPPPDPPTVRKLVLEKIWPTADMIRAGMIISPQAKADIETRFGGAR